MSEGAISPVQSNLLASLDALRTDFARRFEAATTEQVLREENAKILGKKGELTQILKQMGSVPGDQRKAIGERVNTLRKEVEDAFAARLAAIARAKREADLHAPPFDLTLPAREALPLGHRHPITRMREDLVTIFRSLGFAVHDGPDVDLEENNFTKLGFPPDHPAIDEQDSFWTTSGHVLRTHTSNVQVHAMMGQKPPFAFIAPGTCYRRDDDVTHSPMFHQIEGFLVDEKVTLTQLRGVLSEFAARLYGEGTKVRFRASYFPFVEPGAEVDVQCVFCKQPDGTNKGCNVCKHSGWIEILGCGMIDPRVFEACGIDSERYTGFAFGMGIERVAMLRYGIPDIRLLFENDPRFLAQF
ncbi:phenylalanine--tRNA ligase subunit alpha [Pendulispora brunnea]|uniref:Phenylalanine--tRNA ligase alpha subunit n=1 Tax=Pendulispora brunnea TaxID=2905690 RepID=A0ABZ2KDD7_9BACT